MSLQLRAFSLPNPFNAAEFRLFLRFGLPLTELSGEKKPPLELVAPILAIILLAPCENLVTSLCCGED
jgi:hypothetical protein